MGVLETFLKAFHLDKLVGKVEINFIKIIKNDNSQKINCNNESNLTFNIQKLEKKGKRDLQQFLSAAIKQDYILLEENSKILLEDFQKNEASEDTQKKLEFLKPIIPPEDLNIWRAALYLRKSFKTRKREETRELKLEIMQKYGDKGKNIANLCNAGYLETFLIPLYRVLLLNYKEERLTISKFTPIYNSIVKELPFTIFVSRKMSKEKIEKQIEMKKKYGMKFLNIHGIGHENVEKINEVIKKLKKTEDCPIKQEIIEEGNIILVKLCQ